MKKFSYQQKISMMRLLLDIVNADGRIDVRERALFEDFKKRFELDDAAQKMVGNKLSILALLDIKNFDVEQKHYFASLMSQMIVVDEDINVNELAVYDVVKEFCNLFDPFKEKVSGEPTKF